MVCSSLMTPSDSYSIAPAVICELTLLSAQVGFQFFESRSQETRRGLAAEFHGDLGRMTLNHRDDAGLDRDKKLRFVFGDFFQRRRNRTHKAVRKQDAQ